MLGWSFYASNQDIGLIASWNHAYDDWLKEAVKHGDAEQIGFGGGYPDIYKVRVSALPAEYVMYGADTEWCVVEVWDQS